MFSVVFDMAGKFRSGIASRDFGLGASALCANVRSCVCHCVVGGLFICLLRPAQMRIANTRIVICVLHFGIAANWKSVAQGRRTEQQPPPTTPPSSQIDC